MLTHNKVSDFAATRNFLPPTPTRDNIYVAMQGYSVFDRVSKERFLVQNPESPFSNHLMWEGLFDSAEQEDYIQKCCEKFWNTGKQMVIEDYDYQEDEPFYDYSK